MKSAEAKTFSFNLSPTTMWALLLTFLGGSGTLIYSGITLYNRVIAATEAVEAAKPYDEAPMLARLNAVNQQVIALDASVSNVKDTLVSQSNQLVRIQEKASDAIGTASEAKAVANGNARETHAALTGVREEVKATKEGIEAQLNALKRATSNPLGR